MSKGVEVSPKCKFVHTSLPTAPLLGPSFGLFCIPTYVFIPNRAAQMAASAGAHRETEGADCARMMDCHILSAAHNAAITGPKCRVCAAFTIEMRQSVDTESLIISFPPGLRAEHQPDGDETSVSSVLPRHKWGTVLVPTPISKWPFKS